MSDLINSIAFANIGPGKGKDFVSPTGDQFITAGPTREEIKARAPERGVMGAINDNVIEVANAAAGGVSSIANMVSPGNRVSKFIDEEIIKPGEAAQSDQVKAEKKFLQQDMANAQGAGDEITAYLGYMARNPGLAISQVAGSFAIPGLAAKGASRLAGAAGMGAGASSAVGLGSTSVVGGAMAGGDAAGSAYDLVKRTPKKILEQNSEYQELLQSMNPDQALEEIATRAARSASVAPAVIGAVLGPLGAERILAGAGRPLTASRAKNAFLTGGVDAGTEGLEEGVTQYSSQKAASQYDTTIDPMKGVAGAATAGAVMGAGPGLVAGALQKPAVPNPLQPVVDQASKPGSVLSRAVVSTGVTDQAAQAAQATQPGVDQTQSGYVDPIAQRVQSVVQTLETTDTLQKLRDLGPQMGAENLTSDFLYALQVARNPNSRPDQREAAINQVEQAIEWTKTGFTMPQEQPQQPGTSVALRENNAVGPVGQAQFFDPNTIDGEAVRTDNMIGGPRALTGPQRGLTTQPTEQPAAQPAAPAQEVAQNEQPAFVAPNEQQNVATPNTVVQAQRAASLDGMAEVQAPRVAIPAGTGPAVLRKRAAVAKQLAENGFETVQRDGKDFFMVNSKTGQKFKLDGPADAQMARKAINDRIDALANTAAASPKNDLKEPTQAQINAGNYKKSDVINLNGMQIKIENPQGSIRRGVGPDGKAWETKMAHHYGEFQGTVGADGDKLDVFLGPRKDSNKIYVIDQVNEDGSFDEHKVMMGFTTADAAREGYLANYEKGWTGLGAMTEMSPEEFKTWAKSRAAKRPASSVLKDAASAGQEQFTEEEKAEEPNQQFTYVNDEKGRHKLRIVKPGELQKKASGERKGKYRELTQGEAKTLEQIAAVIGRKVVFFEPDGEFKTDGFVRVGDPSTIYIKKTTSINPLAVFGHEFFHTLRETNPKAWDAIAEVVATKVTSPQRFRKDRYGKTIAEQRGDAELSRDNGGELEELISDLGGNLLKDSKFWKKVFDKIAANNGAEAKGIIAKLSAAIQSAITRMVKALDQRGFAADSFVKDLDQVRAAFSDAMAEHMKGAEFKAKPAGAQVKKTEERPEGLTIEGYHFSKSPRQVLNSSMFGTGLKGSARDEIKQQGDDRLKQRIYFYVNKGTGINPEAGVGGVAHKATLTNVYDGDADPLRLRSGNARDFESKVLDAGYSGYLTRLGGTQSGQVIMLGKQTIKAEALGTGKVEGAEVVPAPAEREQDLADRINSNKALPAGMLSPLRWSEVLMQQMPAEAAQLMDIGAFEGDRGLYKDELVSKIRGLTSQIKKSAERSQSEYAEVEAKYKGTDAWMKAPDGTATKLTERQWVQTRTPSFKKWFGDWEAAHANGGVWANNNVSKAVGENGEPLVVYHGTDTSGFTEFDKPSGKGRGDLGIWTTPDYGMASSYVRKGRARDVELSPDPSTREELESFDYSFVGDDGDFGYTDTYGNFYRGFDSEESAVQDALANFEMPDESGETSGVYALFINVRNPNEENFEGAMWNGEREDQYQVRDENDEPIYDDKGRGYFDLDTANALAEQNPGAEVQPADPNYQTTDDVVRDALRNDNDGAIIREVIDDGGGVGYFLDPQDIFVAFNPSQVKSADYNNGEFSDSTDDLRKSTERLQREDPFEMSTRIPTAKGKVVEDHTSNLLISDFAAGKKQEKWVESVANLVTQYPNYREAASAKTSAQKLERLVRHMVENLVWLHNQVPADTRQRSKLWYDGANRIAQRMSRKYELTPAQSSGILAVLSPQKDWFMNVSLGERVASIMAERQNFQWSKDMEATANRIYGAAKYQEDVDAIRGKSLSDLDGDAYLQAMWVRTYDQAHNSSSFGIVSPEGDSLAVAKAKTGKPVKVAWGGNSTIAKAISIFDDGSADNISQQLGTKHKVRNFFNNILTPKSKNGHVTIDTHAVAAALLRPLSGNSLEVMQNFGGTSNAISGLQGTYALYEEAYRRAAEELGLLPRELQSITWEAVRGLYTPGFKSQSKNVDAIDKIWNQYKKGRLSYDGAKEWALETAGGIEPPSWLGRDPGAYVEDESSLEPGDVSGDGVSGGDSEDAFIRAVGDDSGTTEEGIRKSGDRGGREEGGSIAPLPGAPAVQGASGPDPRIVQVAEKYARDNGIKLSRQAEYVEVDPERGARIAAAYEAMPHAPQDPKVKAAFANLIRQTRAQYDALVDAGYKFTFFDSKSDPYDGNPWNAMRDLRENQRMAVYGTYDGYGTEGVTKGKVDDNPMLADTGLEWEDQDGKPHPVLANDLFRAVHDAFGHGLEGAGFRARGEENAWQAHTRLFTGSAVAAITTETRGQNSWLNYGPYGEKNRTAKLEDTVFADQKTGLMPEWTWKEGVAGDMDSEIRQSPARRNDLMASRLAKIDIRSVDDFWRTWRNLMIGTAGPDPRMSAIGSTDSQAKRVDGLVRAHRNDAEKGGIFSVLRQYNGSTEWMNRSGKGDDGLVGSAIAKRILQSAGIKPTVENAVAAYESLPGSGPTQESTEVSPGETAEPTYNQRIQALKDLISCLKK